ncbi:YoaK family protein [uncultured Hymenobacter sp.]|uniref:YoaK family protein n=1 Tax=uncultured Hymenobacter sp. TaxID=170016 RepID=UPI0035CB830D
MNNNQMLSLTLLLTLVAGYCDTVTFLAADELFSAHVTGNFIVFAYHLVQDASTANWSKLLSFPVFIAAVATGRWVANTFTSRYAMLGVAGVLLLVSGALVLFLQYNGRILPSGIHWAAMLVVFAMGMQNAFGRLFAKETYGPTTVMTGNVTQATLDIAARLTGPAETAGKGVPIRVQLLVIGAFLLGCLSGALVARQFGLWPVALAGLVLLVVAARKPAAVPVKA